MEKNYSMLPYVFGIVSQRPQRMGSYNEIFKELQALLKTENLCAPENIKGAVDDAIQEGKKLGVLSTKDGHIYLDSKFLTGNVGTMRDENAQNLQELDGSKLPVSAKHNQKSPIQGRLAANCYYGKQPPLKANVEDEEDKKLGILSAKDGHTYLASNIYLHSTANVGTMLDKHAQIPHELDGPKPPESAKVIEIKRRHKKCSPKAGRLAGKRYKGKQPPLKANVKDVEGKKLGIFSAKDGHIYLASKVPPANVGSMRDESVQSPHELDGPKPPKIAKPKVVIKTGVHKTGRPAAKRYNGQQPPLNANVDDEEDEEEENPMPMRRKQPFRAAKQGKNYRY